MTIAKQKHLIAFALFGILAVGGIVLGILTHRADAGTSHNVVGYAWNQNIGWISLNNCTDPTDSATCGATTYGVSYNESNGTFSGRGWNQNIGFIDFGVSGGPYASEWARAQTGGGTGSADWEGWIDMAGVSYNGPDFGGYAWSGEDLNNDGAADIGIGWINFSTAGVVQGCTDSSASNYEPLAVHDDGSCNTNQGGAYCLNETSITSAQGLATYNTTNNTNWVLDASTGLCADPSDMCPDNSDAQWDGIQTASWVSNYNAANDPDIVVGPSGYCIIPSSATEICGNGIDDDGDGQVDEGCITTPGGGSVTIPTFEEI